MGDYFPPIKHREGNIIYTADGTVWANYLLRGINVNPYDLDSVEIAQRSHDRLFAQLSHLPANDFLLLGAKAQTPPATIMAKCTAGIPDFSEENYPDLHAQYNALYRRIETGERAEYQRIFLLSVGFPVSQSILDGLLSSVAVVDPHRNVERRAITELEERYFRAIPNEFVPRRATADYTDWVFDRVRMRGISVPHFPEAVDNRVAVRGPRSFPEVHINKGADTDSLFDDFIDKVKDDNPDVMNRGQRGLPVVSLIVACLAAAAASAVTFRQDPWIGAALTVLAIAAVLVSSSAVKTRSRDGQTTFRQAFKSARWGQTLAVHNVETRSRDFPDGYTSYQTQVGIARYPTSDSFDINTFTYMVDQEIGLDADFAIRFDFDQSVISKTGFRRARNELNAEDAANTQDEFDAEDYEDTRNEQRDYRDHVKGEPAPRAMRVAAVFSFAHQNKVILDEQVGAIVAHFEDKGFTTTRPVAGQYDLWQAMMPGSACPQVVDDLKQPTTARLFGAFMPIRRTVLGDPVGIPIMVNEENALGQLVLWDVLNATDRGNASTAASGDQGSGKSEFVKMVLAFMHDLLRYVHAVDLDPDGEYSVFAQTLSSHEIIHVTQPELSTGGGRSLDILKCFEPRVAARLFMALWLPLLGFKDRSEEANVLSNCVAPDYRAAARIDSTRNLIDHLAQMASPAARELSLAFLTYARLPDTAAFIDPIVNGKQMDYPPVDFKKRAVVFRCHELSVHRPKPGESAADADPAQQFAAMAFTAIAHLTERRFAKIDGVCAFIADELKLLKGSKVMQQLIEKPDRIGRKAGNFVVVAHQLGDDADEHTALIQRKLMLRQKTRANAASQFVWGDVPPTRRLVTRCVGDTSPRDPENPKRPIKGREGEGWYNDSGMIGRVRTLGHLRRDRRRYSDTIASTRIKARDVPELNAGETAEQRNRHTAVAT